MQFNTVVIKIIWCKISIFSSILNQDCEREIITPIPLWEWVISIVSGIWVFVSLSVRSLTKFQHAKLHVGICKIPTCKIPTCKIVSGKDNFCTIFSIYFEAISYNWSNITFTSPHTLLIHHFININYKGKKRWNFLSRLPADQTGLLTTSGMAWSCATSKF